MAATLYLNNSKELDILLGYLHLPPKLIEVSKKRRFGIFGIPGPAFQQGEKLTSGILSTSKALVGVAASVSPGVELLLGLNDFDKAQVCQWILYYEMHIKPLADDHQSMLKRAEELTDHLSRQTFMVGNHITLADLFLFQYIHSFMNTLSFQDKEKFIHLSRWFQNMQNTLGVKEKLPLVHFHKTKLYT